MFSLYITKTDLYNIDPLKPHFYIVKLGFTGVYIIFRISARKLRLWVPTIYILSRNMKNIRVFLSENFQFLDVKFSIYLNRHGFVRIYRYQNACFVNRAACQIKTCILRNKTITGTLPVIVSFNSSLRKISYSNTLRILPPKMKTCR